MGLSGAVVRVLPQDHHAHVGEGCGLECGEDLGCGRAYVVLCSLGQDEFVQNGEVRRLEFRSENLVPTRSNIRKVGCVIHERGHSRTEDRRKRC